MDNLSETIEFFKSELKQFEEYRDLKYKSSESEDDNDYICKVIKHYKIAIEALIEYQDSTYNI